MWYCTLSFIVLGISVVTSQGWGEDSLFNGPWIQYINRQNQAIADSIAKQTWTPCLTSGEESLRGSCLSNQDCFLRGGKLHFSGNCGLLETCCTEQRTKCGGTSYTKVSYFSSSEQSVSGTRCEHNVKFISRSVCQVRLDLERFHIAAPLNDTTNTDTYARCINDVFTVTPALNKIPDLCGNNDGQHIYIHVNGEQLESLQLKFIFANRSLDASTQRLVTPSWRIKITQLECPVKRNRFTSTSNIDYPLIAPSDCLQFYNESSGSIQSFNYKNGGPYPTNTEYSICIDRSPSACGIAYTPTSFLVAGPGKAPTPTPGGYRLEDDDLVGADETCPDDLVILQPATGPLSTGAAAAALAKVQKVYYCGAVGNATITRYSPGPFYAVFHSTTVANKVKQGFNINYRVLENC